MKRLTLTTAVLAILMAPAAFAQSTLNTTAPGASQETKPGQTNNNLQNPGSKMAAPPATTTTTTTMQEPSTEPAPAPAPEATGTMNSTDTTTPPATDTTTTGTMNNTDTSGTTGAYTGSTSTSTTTSSKLPKTASDLPTVMMAGLLALFAAFALRFYSKRNA